MDTDNSRSTNEQKNEVPERHPVLRVLLAPLSALNRGLTALLKRALGNSYTVITEDQLLGMVDALAKAPDDDTIEEDSAQMINNIFAFGSLNAGDVMTHRTSIVGVELNSTALDDLIYLALDMGFSRIPVYEESIDKIVGIIIVKDLLCLIGREDLSDFKPKDFKGRYLCARSMSLFRHVPLTYRYEKRNGGGGRRVRRDGGHCHAGGYH